MQHPRYALMSGPDAVALCKDVRGLYGEPAHPARAVHELRDCRPDGDLARAVAQATAEGTAPFGTLHLRTRDGRASFLDGVRVLGAHGDTVTVESNGGPRRSYAWPSVHCADLVRISPPEPPERTHADVTFLGCSPRGALRDAIAAGAPEFETVRYQVLDSVGNGQHEDTAGPVVAWDTSATHHGLLDLTVSFPRAGLIPPGRREVWDLFHGYEGPAEPGTWRRFTGADRVAWMDLALRRRHRAPEVTPGATYHLDGRDVIDEDTFSCALGEAVLGPGHRLMEEDLGGITLVWHHSDVARACLGVLPFAGRRLPETFRQIVDGLRDEGVQVVLD
ncbi:hypothetical protein [Streptomyces roseicoloratus]|uniref:Barstar (barnase inhibitor) domain-containing protein n=1 Tax=Streptomyces roseicoloratus TaxID=2508722 RepID=A0ABY9RUC6_9ACTN|nr:hypothetical protein [Streptomyces roseicoloratus]WMX45575.1 hypothetical protein RGF97_12910 [Streptomyces roseicoloratus]